MFDSDALNRFRQTELNVASTARTAITRSVSINRCRQAPSPEEVPFTKVTKATSVTDLLMPKAPEVPRLYLVEWRCLA